MNAYCKIFFAILSLINILELQILHTTAYNAVFFFLNTDN